jgi:hypothetical protein
VQLKPSQPPQRISRLPSSNCVRASLSTPRRDNLSITWTIHSLPLSTTCSRPHHQPTLAMRTSSLAKTNTMQPSQRVAPSVEQHSQSCSCTNRITHKKQNCTHHMWLIQTINHVKITVLLMVPTITTHLQTKKKGHRKDIAASRKLRSTKRSSRSRRSNYNNHYELPRIHSLFTSITMNSEGKALKWHSAAEAPLLNIYCYYGAGVQVCDRQPSVRRVIWPTLYQHTTICLGYRMVCYQRPAPVLSILPYTLQR